MEKLCLELKPSIRESLRPAASELYLQVIRERVINSAGRGGANPFGELENLTFELNLFLPCNMNGGSCISEQNTRSQEA